MKIPRRRFLHLAAGAATLPTALRIAQAQQPAMPVIGFLNSGSPDRYRLLLDAFRQGLNDGGYVEGRNVAIESRWAEGQSARLPELAADLVRRQVSLIAATGGSASAHAAKAATATIPVLFIGGPDPVADGLVSSLNRPGGNLTGVGVNTSELLPKRVQQLLELIPNSAKIAVLLNRDGVGADAGERDVEAATRALGRQMISLKISSRSDLEAAFVSAVRQHADALFVGSNSLFTNWRVEIVALAARHALPAAYAWREFVEAGGLISYGPSVAWAYRQIGQYASRILKGEKPADLPVMLPTKFELVINLQTAKALGLTIPETLLATADEVLE
jgi:putative tryptophan/tyrosine transport system substrate-binding protein